MTKFRTKNLIPRAVMKGRVHPNPFQINPYRPTGESLFVPGNTLSKAENLTADANARRKAGLVKAWSYHNRRGNTMFKDANHKLELRRKMKLCSTLKTTTAKDIREIQEIIKERIFYGLEEIFKIMADEAASPIAKIAALNLLLDRAYGKASQTNINANIDANGQPSEISQKELDDRIKATIARVEALAGGTPEAQPGTDKPADVRELN